MDCGRLGDLATRLLRGGGAAGLNTCEAWHRAENATYASTVSDSVLTLNKVTGVSGLY